jgi:hypothetical protein
MAVIHSQCLKMRQRRIACSARSHKSIDITRGAKKAWQRYLGHKPFKKQYVLWLQVAMCDAETVDVRHSLDDLLEEAPALILLETCVNQRSDLSLSPIPRVARAYDPRSP